MSEQTATYRCFDCEEPTPHTVEERPYWGEVATCDECGNWATVFSLERRTGTGDDDDTDDLSPEESKQATLMTDGGTEQTGIDHEQVLTRRVCGECGEDLPSGDLSDTLLHYLNQHPDSGLLTTLLDSVTLQNECSECGAFFDAEVDNGQYGHIITPAYCDDCIETLGPLYGLFVDEWHVDLVADVLTPSGVGQATTRVLDGGKVSPEWNDLRITCPNCNYGTYIDFENPYCDHCNAIVRVSITAHMTGGGSDE